MPRPSIFTPAGQLSCSSAKPLPQQFYDTLNRLYNGKNAANMGPASNFDMTPGGHFEATVYAKARSLARAKASVIRAGSQRNPSVAYDMLPSLEKDYQVQPAATDGIATRQANVAARRMLPNGALPWNIAVQLRAILGTDYIGYFPVWPTFGDKTVLPGSTNLLNAKIASAPSKWLQLLEPVTQTGQNSTVQYGSLDPDDPLVPLLENDVVMVQPDKYGTAEKVTVLSAVAATATTPAMFTAQFHSPHDIGGVITDMDWPMQWSTARLSVIAVLHGSAYDIAKRNRVHQAMESIERSVGVWAIVGCTPTAAAGVYSLDEVGDPFKLCSTIIGSYTVTQSY